MSATWERLVRSAVEALEWAPAVQLQGEAPSIACRVNGMPEGHKDRTAINAALEFDKQVRFGLAGASALGDRLALQAALLGGEDISLQEFRYRRSLADALWTHVRHDPRRELEGLARPQGDG